MNGVFAAVKAAGIADRDMQTSNLSLNPVYDYPPNQQPRMRGYNATNQITIKVRDIKSLGKTLDAVVKGGGNNIQGVSFSIDKPEAYQNEARVEAIKDAAAEAELYANAVGYSVKRIVTISEQEFYPQPMPMMARMQLQDAGPESTPVAAGEVSLTQTVSVTFELSNRAVGLGVLTGCHPGRAQRGPGSTPRLVRDEKWVPDSASRFRDDNWRASVVRLDDARHHLIPLIQLHYARRVLFGGLFVHLGEGGDDHAVADLEEAGGGAVDADGLRAARRLDRVGGDPRAVGDVPDIDLLVRQDVGLLPADPRRWSTSPHSAGRTG